MNATAEAPVRRPRGRPRNDATREATRRRILDAARDVFSARGYHEASVDDVVRASGLSKGGFYFHFPSKDAVFEVLYDELADELYGRALAAAMREADPLDRLAAGVRAFLRGCHELQVARLVFAHPGGTHPLLERKRSEATDRFAELIRVSLDEAVGLEELPPVNTRVLARAMVGAFAELGSEVVRTQDPEEVEEVADVLVDLLCFMALSATVGRNAPAPAPTTRSKE